MHVVLKAFPCSFDGVTSTELQPGFERDFGSMAEGLKQAGLIGEIVPQQQKSVPGDDGPTIAEWVAAGYLASKYPPAGYTSRSTPEEIDAAIADEANRTAAEEAANAKDAMKADLAGQTVAHLRDLAKAESIELESDDKKDEIIEKIATARLGKSA